MALRMHRPQRENDRAPSEGGCGRRGTGETAGIGPGTLIRQSGCIRRGADEQTDKTGRQTVVGEDATPSHASRAVRLCLAASASSAPSASSCPPLLYRRRATQTDEPGDAAGPACLLVAGTIADAGGHEQTGACARMRCSSGRG